MGLFVTLVYIQIADIKPSFPEKRSFYIVSLYKK